MNNKSLSMINDSINTNQKTGISIISRLKGMAKKNRLIIGLYSWFQFFRGVRGKDLWSICRRTPKNKLIMTVKPYTMMGYSRLSNLYELVSLFEKKGISGSFVECGVCNGGSAAVIATVAKDNINRHVWLFDPWEGFPEPDENDIDFDPRIVYEEGYACDEANVKNLFFDQMLLDDSRVHLVKGWFSDTLPKSDVGAITLLHLNHPLYRSIKYCLEQLYDNIIEGGGIVIDDYGYWKGCKKALDEFIENRKLKIELIRVDYHAAYFFKKLT